MPIALNANRKAFLGTIAFAEGTSTSPITSDRGYDVIVTGIDGKPEIFWDYRAHPFADGRKSKQINSRGLTSNASGRYQFMLKDYFHYKALLHLPDFGPESQDQWALQLIRERGALALIDAGRFDDAVARVSNLWASLPGANYPGQPMHKLEKLRDAYLKAGGVVA